MSSTELKKLIDIGDLGRARAKILVELDNDRFRQKMTVFQLVQPFYNCKLFVEDDQDFMFLPKTEWTRPYWTRMCVELSNNFSEIKLKHVVEVMEFLRKKGDPKFIPKNRQFSVPIGSSKKPLQRRTGPRRESRDADQEPGPIDRVWSEFKKRVKFGGSDGY